MNHFTLEMKELQFLNEVSRKSDSLSYWEGFYSGYTSAEPKGESVAGDVDEAVTLCYVISYPDFLH